MTLGRTFGARQQDPAGPFGTDLQTVSRAQTGIPEGLRGMVTWCLLLIRVVILVARLFFTLSAIRKEWIPRERLSTLVVQGSPS